MTTAVTGPAAVELAEELRRSNARVEILERLALRDPLTGLMNRRAFYEQLEAELARAERGAYPVALVALDLDSFKQVNDVFGHPVGDEVLCAGARRLAGGVRPGDLCARVGGDEFSLALVNAPVELAEEIVRRLGVAVASIAFGPGHSSLTISAGIAVFPGHAPALPALMAVADSALYRAKRCGGGRVCVASAPTGVHPSTEERAYERRRVTVQNAVAALARAVEVRNGYTHLHSHGVAAHTASLASALGMDDDRVDEIRLAAVLHDVGMIGVPDAVMFKEGPLSAEEVDCVRRHSAMGADMLLGAGLPEVAHWVRHLHERFDGGGYPGGLSGEAIPLESRVLCVADAIDAMTRPRLYRTPLDAEGALGELRRGAGKQFDPHVVAVLLGIARRGELELRSGREVSGVSPVAYAGL